MEGWSNSKLPAPREDTSIGFFLERIEHSNLSHDLGGWDNSTFHTTFEDGTILHFPNNVTYPITLKYKTT